VANRVVVDCVSLGPGFDCSAGWLGHGMVMDTQRIDGSLNETLVGDVVAAVEAEWDLEEYLCVRSGGDCDLEVGFGLAWAQLESQKQKLCELQSSFELELERRAHLLIQARRSGQWPGLRGGVGNWL
jgi:hypothetical protein